MKALPKKEAYVDPALPEQAFTVPKEFRTKVHKSMKGLEDLYAKYQKESSDQTPLPKDDVPRFIEWALHYSEYCEEGMQSGENCHEAELNNKTCFKAHSREHFFRSFLPDFLSGNWPIRFNRKFLSKLSSIKSEDLQLYILHIISQYCEGYLSSTVDLQGLSYMIFFKAKIPSQNSTMVSCAHIERIPEFSGPNKVKSFKYVHVFRILDLLNESDKVTALHTCLNFLEDCKKDPARQECTPKVKEEKTTKYKTMTSDGREIYSNRCFEVEKYFRGEAILLNPDFDHKKRTNYNDNTVFCFRPMEFEINYLTPTEVEDLVYYKDIKRWVSKKAHAMFLRKQEESVVSRMNAEIIAKFADFESSGRLVELLEKMKNLKIKLTGEEKKLIGQDGNVLAIGRSGTGKTTCCVLRLFSQDLLYKFRLAQSQVQQGMLRDTRNMSDNLDNLIGLHSVFVTASPVLTNEVSRYYTNLSKRIKNEMKKKEPSKKTEEIKKEPESESSYMEITTEKEKTEEVVEQEEEEAFNEEDYLMDDEEAEILAKLNKNYSLENIEDKEFPLFLTVKRLVLMIDGSLQDPFFARKQDNTIIGSDTHAQWHNELKGLMMISDKYREQTADGDDDAEPNLTEPSSGGAKKEEDDQIKEEDEEDDEEEEGYDETMKIDDDDIEKEYERYQAILKKKKEQYEEEGRLRKKNKMSFEVDYEYFLNHFWNGHLSRQDRPTDLSPIIVWSEITSTIKGSADSHLSPGFYLNKEVYTSLQKEGSTFLNLNNRTKVYDLFITYEEWKNNEGGYDFMDIVNHALNEVRLRGYNGVPIHFTMIDEVQDLSHATILLLTKITEQSIFFAGDTAQTIAKGVGVRFSDLSTIFKDAPEKEQMWKRPVVHQLTVNFRSHGKILDIANSVVSLMETYFPKTIDKLKKEKSEVDGPKPIILEDVNMDVLFAVLFGTETFKSHRHSQNQGSALEKPPIEFGCNQAIIVRDQESKNKLPPLLKHALCLTVYEAKGLEFDDVILYNFFSESPLTAKEWELLSLLDIEDKKVDKDTFERHYFTYKEEKSLSDLKTEEDQNKMDFGRHDDDNDGKNGELDLEAPNLFNAQLDQNTNQYSLKKVGLAKRVYEVYDYFENYGMVCNEFKQLYVALTRPRNRIVIYDDDIVKRQPMEKYWKDLNLVQIISKDILENAAESAVQTSSSANKDLESFKSLIASTSEEEWKKQGLKMFRNKYYEQAVKCFERSKDEPLRKRAEAYMLAEQASNTIRTIKSEQNLILRDLNQLREKDMKEKRVRAKQLRVEEKTCFAEYERAANIFVELNLLKQAAQCFFSAEIYEKALEIYEKLGLLREAGEACFMLKQFERTADLFLKGGDFVRAIECYEQNRDYNKILQVLENIKDLPAQQRKYYAQRYVPLALKGLAEQLENKPNEEVEKNDVESDQEEEESLKKKEKQVSEMSFEVIDGEQKSKQASIIEVSLDKSKKSVSDITFENAEEDLDNFEHLSQYDVINDEFLKSESGSIIDSIASHRKEKSMVSSSEFSAIDYNYLMDNHYQLVKTKADIFVQDSMMEKIIKYINMFSEDFRESLQNLRSKDVLLTEVAHISPDQTNLQTISNNLIDLDNISLDFVYFALDFLEQHKLFKLCIFVCNRYSLANKLGRYLANMAFRYSNFPHDDISASFTKIIQHRSRQIQQEKAFVANLALHNVLEIMNPKYLKLKKKGETVDETNSLGDDCFSQMISLGFWKKCLFLMDYKNSLGLASTFASFTNYKLLYLTGSDEYSNLSKEDVKKSVESEGFGFLQFQTPSSNDEVQAAILNLEAVIWDLSEKFPSHLYKHYKHDISTVNSSIKVPQFPLYFVCNEALWNFIVNKRREKLDEVLESATIELEAILNNKEVSPSPILQARLFDIITFMVQIIVFYNTNHLLSDFINKLGVRVVTRYLASLAKIVEHTLDGPSLSRYEETIIKAILSPLRLRYIERTSVLEKIGLHNYLAHISSPLMSEIIPAHSSVSSNLLYDIEGNFVLVSIGVCLKSIRKRIADTMRAILGYQLKSYDSYSERTRMVHVLDEVKEYIEDKAQLLSAISSYSYCQHFVQGIKNSPVKKPITLSETKKKKVERQYEDDDDDGTNEDEKFDNMLGDYGKGKVDVKSRLDKISKKKPAATSNASSKSKEPTESEANLGIGNFRRGILREIKRLFGNSSSITFGFDYQARTELLAFALQKLNKYIRQNTLKLWVIHLLFAIGHRISLNEVLRKNKNNVTAQNLQVYSDAIYYKQFLSSEDYTNSIFDFLAAAENLRNNELLSILEDLVPYVIAAGSVGQKSSQICLTPSLLHGLGVSLKSSDKAQTLETNMTPLDIKTVLSEVMNWIAVAADKLGGKTYGNSYFCRIIPLIQNLLANVPDLDENSFNTVNEAFGYFVEDPNVDFSAKETRLKNPVFRKREDLSKAEASFVQALEVNLETFEFLGEENSTQLVSSFIHEDLVVIDLQNDSKVAKKNFERSEAAFLQDQVKVAKRITLQRKLKKLFFKKGGIKLREKLLFNACKTGYPFRLIETGKNSQDILRLIASADVSLGNVFASVDENLRRVLNYYGRQVISTTIDFHYIWNLSQRLVEHGLEFVQGLEDCLKNKKRLNELKELYKEKLNKITEDMQQFEAWHCASQDAKVEEKGSKRQKLVRAKWEEEALVAKMQQIAKKRKGLKKQALQKERKLRIDNFIFKKR